MIIYFIYYVAFSKFVDSSFPQCNVHTGFQGGCLAFTPLDGYLKLWELSNNSNFFLSLSSTIQFNSRYTNLSDSYLEAFLTHFVIFPNFDRKHIRICYFGIFNHLYSMFFSRSQAIEFYSYLMNSSYVFKKDSLISRAHTVCFSENVYLILYLLNDNYHDMNMEIMGSQILWVSFYKALHSMTGTYWNCFYYHFDISVNCMYSPYRRLNHYK